MIIIIYIIKLKKLGCDIKINILEGLKELL